MSVAIATLAGPAAADGGSSLQVEVTASGPGGQGDGTMDCRGDPVGPHECDKHGNASGGPFQLHYEGFNRGNSAGGPYAFGDNFTFVMAGESFGLNATCTFENGSSGGNPCPVETT